MSSKHVLFQAETQEESAKGDDAILAVKANGASPVGWSDAVWRAISPALGPGSQVVALSVLRRWVTFPGGKPQYHVEVRLACTRGRSAAGAGPRSSAFVPWVETKSSHHGAVPCVAHVC